MMDQDVYITEGKKKNMKKSAEKIENRAGIKIYSM